jgi:hypothetical protein
MVINVTRAKGPGFSEDRSAYKPTEKGREMFRKLGLQGAA